VDGKKDFHLNLLLSLLRQGWTALITDDLCDNVLFMISIAIGLACGLVGLIIGSINSSMFADFGVDHAGGLAFLCGFLCGLLLSNIQMAVVGSAVNTVIVCFAEAPAEFQANHPELSRRMRESWIQAWPGLSI
jgi:hypothetical protein